MANMSDFQPGGQFHYSGQHENVPPWERKKPSLFWQDQLDRVPETSWFSQMPHWVQTPMDAYKRWHLKGQVRDEQHREKVGEVIDNLGETLAERGVRLEEERLKALAEKQELSQAKRRMPTAVDKSAITKEEDDDWLKDMLFINFLQNVAFQSASPDVKPGYGASVGTSRAFPTMPKMG